MILNINKKLNKGVVKINLLTGHQEMISCFFLFSFFKSLLVLDFVSSIFLLLTPLRTLWCRILNSPQTNLCFGEKIQTQRNGKQIIKIIEIDLTKIEIKIRKLEKIKIKREII